MGGLCTLHGEMKMRTLFLIILFLAFHPLFWIWLIWKYNLSHTEERQKAYENQQAAYWSVVHEEERQKELARAYWAGETK
jgi:hypothetical protein